MKFCCDEFAKMAAGDEDSPIPQFERSSDGTWSVNGCCGGGCYVCNGMRFCPFCGARLVVESGYKPS